MTDEKDIWQVFDEVLTEHGPVEIPPTVEVPLELVQWVELMRKDLEWELQRNDPSLAFVQRWAAKRLNRLDAVYPKK